jgi:hypothetical protein
MSKEDKQRDIAMYKRDIKEEESEWVNWIFMQRYNRLRLIYKR